MCAGTKFEVLWLSSNAENVTTTNPQAMHGERRSHKRLYFVKIIDLRRRRRDRVCATPKYICQAGPIVPPCARSICDIVTLAKGVARCLSNPSTGDASSPDVSLGNALILVHTSRYELGAMCPKFSGWQEVPAYHIMNTL